MSATYGSDNPDCIKVEQIDAALPCRARPTHYEWSKVILTAVGTALCIGGSLAMYEGWSSFSTGAAIPSAMTLASAADFSNVNSDVNLLKSGQEILLRVRGKSNLCMDDGGGYSNGETEFTIQTCNPESPNQIFTYDANARMFRSVYKPGMCLDDGGSSKSGTVRMHLWKCVPQTPNQWFTVDPDTLMMRSPGKPNLCVDDGGGAAPGSSKFWLWTCNNANKNQHFEVISRATMLDEVKRARIAAGTQDDLDLLMSGQQIIIRVQGKNNLCMDDGGGHSNGETKFTIQTCNPESPNQIFTYDATARMFRSVYKPGMCLDDGGSSKSGTVRMHLWKCVPETPNQWFTVDPDTLMIRSPGKPNLCVDDGGGAAPGSSKFWLWTCSNTNKNQRFEVLSVSEMLKTSDTAVDEGPGLLEDLMPESPLEPVGKDTGFYPTVPDDGTAIDQESVVYGNGNELPAQADELPHQEATADTGYYPAVPDNNYELPAQADELPQQETTADTGYYPVVPDNSYELPAKADELPYQEATADTGYYPAVPDNSYELPAQADELPHQEADMPRNVPVVKTADMSLANYDGDWNLLGPSEHTINLVNADNAPDVPAAKIFQYLQSLKDQAEVEYNIMMYRYKRTYQCASAGLQTLAQDSVTTDEYHVLVRWMYEHCAAGNTEIAPPLKPMPPLPKDALDTTDVAPLVNDTASDVKRQYMTKMDFYYEIKNHFAQKSETMMGNAAEVNLHLMMTKEQEMKLIDCTEEASQRFDFNGQDNASVDLKQHLQEAIAWVEDSCMKA